MNRGRTRAQPNSGIGTGHDGSSSVAAALFDVRVKRTYEKELCPDRARRNFVWIVMAHARPPKAKGNSDGTTAERKLLGGHCGVQRCR
jgi:hypothetical protein